MGTPPSRHDHTQARPRGREIALPEELQIDNGMNSDDEAEFEASLRAGEGGIRSRDGAVETAGPASPSPGARAHFALAPRSLDCSHQGWGDADAHELVASLQRRGGAYSSIFLRCNRLRDRGAAAVIKALPTTLVHLDLSGNALGSVAAHVLRTWLDQGSPPLQCLALNDTGLGDTGLAIIAKPLGSCRQLEALDLGATKLTGDSGQVLAEMLQRSTHMTRLNLSWNGIRGEGARILLEEIATNTSLQVLDLRFLGLGRDPGAVAALAHVLQENTSLTHLDIGFNRLEASHAETLGDALREGGNTALLGLHVDGNSIALDAQGFVHAVHAGPLELLDRLPGDSRQLDVESTAREVAPGLDSITNRASLRWVLDANGCWVCECWRETTLAVPAATISATSEEEIRIHLACDGWDGVPLPQRGGCFSITRMLPPGVAAFFYSRRSPARVEAWHAERARRDEMRKRWKERMAEEGAEAAARAADGGTTDEGEPEDPEVARQAAVWRVEQEAQEEEAGWDPLPDAAPVTYFTVPSAPALWELRADATAKDLEEMLPSLRFLHPKQGSPSRNPYRHYLRLPASVQGLATVNVALVQPSLCVRPQQAVPRADRDAISHVGHVVPWTWRNSVFAQRAEDVEWSSRARARARRASRGAGSLAAEGVGQVLQVVEALAGGNAPAASTNDHGGARLFASIDLPALRIALQKNERMDSFGRVFNYLAARSMAEVEAPSHHASHSGVTLKVLREVLEASDAEEWGVATRARVESAARACRHQLLPLFDAPQPSRHEAMSPRGSVLVRYRPQTLVVGLAVAEAVWESAVQQRKAQASALQAASAPPGHREGNERGGADSGEEGLSGEAGGSGAPEEDKDGPSQPVGVGLPPLLPLEEFAAELLCDRAEKALPRRGIASDIRFRERAFETKEVEAVLQRHAACLRHVYAQTVEAYRRRPNEPHAIHANGALALAEELGFSAHLGKTAIFQLFLESSTVDIGDADAALQWLDTLEFIARCAAAARPATQRHSGERECRKASLTAALPLTRELGHAFVESTRDRDDEGASGAGDSDGARAEEGEAAVKVARLLDGVLTGYTARGGAA